MPWTAARRRFETLLDQFAISHARVSEVTDIAARIARTPLPVPHPFVSVLAMAEGPRGRTTLGATKRIVDERDSLCIRAHFDLKNITLIVFADLERVEVIKIVCGIESMTAAVGGCPIVFFPEWPLGFDVNVYCKRF